MGSDFFLVLVLSTTDFMSTTNNQQKNCFDYLLNFQEETYDSVVSNPSRTIELLERAILRVTVGFHVWRHS